MAMNSKEQLLNPVPAAAMAVMTTSITELTPVDMALSAGTLTTQSATTVEAIKNISPQTHSQKKDLILNWTFNR